MARSIELLLTETIENLGIVGDIVKVKAGYARNYLLPHAMAEFPTAAKIESLKEARAKAQAMLAKMRAERESLLTRMSAVEITLQRSCNDQGVLYGSITQRDIADALVEAGYGVDVRAVRLSQSIRRVGAYHVPIQFEKDLKTEITLNIKADRMLEMDTPAERHAELETAPDAEATETDGEESSKPAGKGEGKREGKPDGKKSKDDHGDKPSKSEGKSGKGAKAKAGSK